MSQKLSLLSSLLLPVFIFLFIFGSCIQADAADTVYARNGEVYVMIGEGTRMGVYASQKLDANGNRITVRPDGVKLFGDPTKMSNYQAIAVDQFRNIYVLAAKLDPGLINLPAGQHFWVDPPKEEGICGVGNDGTMEYHDVLNHCDTMPGNPHGGRGVSNRATEKYSGHAGWSYLQGQTPGGTAHNTGAYAAPVDPPQAQKQVYDAKYNRGAGRSLKRIPLNYWYCGFLNWTGNSGAAVNCNNSTVTWQVKYDVKIQRVNLWISHYVDGAFVPPGALPGLPTDPQITPNQVKDMFEEVFNTVNMQYTYARATMCGESFHPGGSNPVQGNINTDYKIGFTTTGAGRRYVYSSLPTPKIKKGTIRLTAGNTFGIPQMDSADFTALDGSQVLNSDTLSMGAATKDPINDYVYTCPQSDPSGWDIIGFAVADQWDGTGGVRYMLLQAPGAPGKKFDKDKGKKLRWNKMEGGGYVPSNAGGVKSGLIDLQKDVKVIAGDGSGSVYYLTDPRAVFDAASGADTFWSDNSTVSNLVPLTTPGKPEGPRATTNGQVWQWKRKFTARAATELFQIDYYTKTETKLNDFTVGQEEALVLEVFADPNGQNLITRQAIPDVIPPKIADIKLALATINLAGPPVGNNEKMCVDIVSSNAVGNALANMRSKDITTTNRDGGVLGEAKIEGDEIAEDTQYRCYMENAPPVFSQDLIKKNTISGLVLKDENNNGTIGGFDYALRPGTACYYWRVEMVEPMKKVITPDTGFTSTRTTPGTAVNLTRVTTVPASWAALGDKKQRSQNVNLADGSWYCSRGPNADRAPNQEDPNAAEAAPDFAFTPKEPGIYKISLIASAKKWNYGVLGYPSYITDRETVAGCKDATTHYLFFDNGEGGGTAKNGVKDGGEDYVAERYIVVTAKQPEPDKYITGIQFENPITTIDENQVGTWTVKANLRYIKSFNHEVGNPTARQLMETYNGIGCWDYPDTAVADWGLGPYDGVGEDYVTGAPAGPSNGVKNGANSVMNPKLRNFGEKAPGSNPFTATTPELPGVPPNIIFGTPNSFATWVVGAGTSANPAMPLNKADRGCVEYEWLLAAEEIKDDGTKVYHGATNAAKPIPEFVIARGRLSDEKPFPGDNSKKAVSWANYANNDRKFDVRVTLRYAFDVPLDPGKYYLYIKFKYPKLKWEGRSPKKDKDGNLVKDAQGNQIYAYYDLVSDGVGETMYHVDNWAVVDGTPVPAGLAITVKDLQPPQAFFTSDTHPNNPDQATPLPNATIPLCGVEYKGGTTGDPFKGQIKFSVCDNNPNKPLGTIALRAMMGARQKALAFADVNTVTKTEEKYLEFNMDRLKMALEKTIFPKAAQRPPGVVQDVTNEVTIVDTTNAVTSGNNKGINTYFGYGVDAPYRRAKFQLNNPETVFTSSKIPYDMIGNLPMYATGADGSGNKIADFDRNGQYNELEAQVNNGATSAVSEKKFPNAPAFITIVDNDAPSIRFYALRTRDNVYREYVITANGALDQSDNNKPTNHAAHHDELDWDATAPGKLKFTSWGMTEVTVKDCNLDGSVATLTGQNNPVHPTASMPNNTGKCTQLRPNGAIADIGVAQINGKDCYVVKYGGKAVGISETYNSYAPTNVAYYEFDKILPANAGDMLELIEDARSRFEISAVDNVDNTIAVVQPTAVTNNNPQMMAGNCYVDTLNLGDALTLGEVMGSWKQKGSIIETYGIFRDPTPAGANNPSMFIVIKDNSGNATAVKIPMIILHTLFRPNVINVESRRSE